MVQQFLNVYNAVVRKTGYIRFRVFLNIKSVS